MVGAGSTCGCGCGREVAPGRRYAPGHRRFRARGPSAAGWRGGRWRHVSGYIYRYAPWHPRASRDGYVPEHHLVMEDHLGRLLRPGEKVFHRNGIKSENAIDNLRLQPNPRGRARGEERPGGRPGSRTA